MFESFYLRLLQNEASSMAMPTAAPTSTTTPPIFLPTEAETDVPTAAPLSIPTEDFSGEEDFPKATLSMSTLTIY